MRCGRDEPRDAAKRLQREVLRAGWHLRADGGVNLHGYAWRHDGGPDFRIHGVVILAPTRFVDPLPPVNPARQFVGLLEPGDALIHHCETIHCSAPNPSPKPRWGLLFVLRGEHTRTDPELKAAYEKARPKS